VLATTIGNVQTLPGVTSKVVEQVLSLEESTQLALLLLKYLTDNLLGM
jgi:hypothetical protein